MGHNIPVFFFPVSICEIQDSDINQEFVEDLIARKYHARVEYGIRQVTSRSWWYQYSINDLTRYMGITGLEFVTLEIVLLDESSLRLAYRAIDQLLEKISNGIPVFTNDQEDEYAGLTELRNVDCSLAYNQSRSEFEIDPTVDFGFDVVVGFFSFLKSLRSSIEDALANHQYLIYYRPQP